MERMLFGTLLIGVGAIVIACASHGSGRPQPLSVSPEEAARCAGVSDSVSKYVSEDALPLAHIEGTPQTLPVPAGIQAGDSVAVDFVVGPNGLADTTSVVVTGASDPQFVRSATELAAESRFTPARISGCYVVSRYNIVVRGRPR